MAALAVAALALTATAAAQVPDPYEVVLHAGDVMVPMRDGVRLATDVYRPARGGISSSNFPRFDVNPNTGEPLGMHRRTVPADNSIYHEAAYPSHVVLPVVAVTPE